MSKNPGKDFGPIADDYAFFESHATEAREDVRAYVDHVREAMPNSGPLRMLDFGCGSGTVTSRFLTETGWSPERVRLTLVEPVESARQQAILRVASLTTWPVTESAALPVESRDRFDCILANHVFYYVPKLKAQLAALIGSLAPGGILITAIASRANALIEFWTAGFGLLGQDVPYHTAENVEAALRELGTEYDKQQVAYDLSFPDTEENRLRIIRFLLADHLHLMPRQQLLAMFERYSRAGRIEIRTASDHFTVRAQK